MKKNALAIQLVATFIGIALAIFMLVSHTNLQYGIQDGKSFCAVGRFADCDIVTASKYSSFAGVPLASWGALFFFVVFLLSLASRIDNRFLGFSQRWIARFALLAVTIDVLLIVVQLVSIGYICLLCFATYLVTFVILWSALRLLAGPGPLFRDGFRALGDFSLGELKVKTLAPYLIASVLFAGGLILLPMALRMRSQTYKFVDGAIDQFYEKLSETPAKKIDISPDNGVFGNPNAPVTIVAFSDFQCPHCRRAAFTLHTALNPMKHKVRFVFKNFPLDSSCNALVTYQMHPHACNLARLSYCANKKEKFWEFHDEVFMKIPETSFIGNFEDIAQQLSSVFTRDEITSCLRDPKSLAAIQADIRDGQEIGIKSTPTLFFNGRQITIPLTVQTLQKLISLP